MLSWRLIMAFLILPMVLAQDADRERGRGPSSAEDEGPPGWPNV